MKVAEISHRFWPCPGGVETHVLQLCEKLLGKKVDVKAICLNRCPNSSERLPAKESVAGIEVSRLGFFGGGLYKVAPGVLGKIKDCDVVHVHGLGFFSDFLALTKPFHRKRLVLSTHGGVFHTRRLSWLKRIYFGGWCRMCMKAFDRVVAVSRQDLELFAGIVPRKKLVLIENPIDLERLSLGKAKRKRNSFLFVGRLSRNKGLQNLLECFALLKGKGIGFSLQIAGMDFDLGKKDLEEIAASLGIADNVRVLGEVSDKRLLQLYSENEFFVSASEYEGFGISAVEAMAAGLVPVLNSIPTFKGFVQESRNGFIVEFGSAGKSSERIGKISGLGARERLALGENAREHASKYSWDAGIPKFEALYNGLVQS